MIKVFVGCAANDEDLESMAVLEYTLRKHASLPVDITWMRLSADPLSPLHGWNTTQWVTPFSGLRWAVPALCDYRGYAVYMDSDTICQADIADLAIMRRGASPIVSRPDRFCVMLMNCEALQPLMPSLEEIKSNPTSHQRLSSKFANSRHIEPFGYDCWNCVDGEEFEDLHDPRIKVIHYSSICHQPQLRYALPRLEVEGRTHWYNGEVREHKRKDLIELFDKLLSEAIEAGFTLDRYRSDLFGEYEKLSLENYRGMQWAR